MIISFPFQRNFSVFRWFLAIFRLSSGNFPASDMDQRKSRIIEIKQQKANWIHTFLSKIVSECYTKRNVWREEKKLLFGGEQSGGGGGYSVLLPYNAPSDRIVFFYAAEQYP